MPPRTVAILAGLLLTIVAPLSGVAAEFSILRYETVTLSESVQPLAAAYRTASPGMAVRFRAYGTDFALELERNERLNNGLPASRRGAAVAWRGTVVGRPGSWVRLTRMGTRTVGMLSDGDELYTIESGSDARPHIRNPLASIADDAMIIYKLRDTLTDLDGEFCGVLLEAGKSTQADVYHALAAQLQTDVTAALVATKQLELGAVADAELSRAQSNNTEAFVLARLNVVDGIFSEQAGVHLAVRSITTYPQGDDPFSATVVPSELLEELRTFRGSSPTQQATGLTHLMTGRDLDRDTVGIAFFDTLCRAGTAASLSQVYQQSFTNAALITAHEIGHVFGAPHDGESPGACAAQTGAFIMASQLNEGQQFSPCSLAQMQIRVNAASCLAPVAQADAALVVPASAPLALEQTTVVSFQVRSEGPGAISGVQVTVALPPGILAVGAGATDGTCTVSGAVFQIVCSFATVPVGESREVQMSLQGLSLGTSTASITLTASGDGVSSNNSAQLALVTAPGADLSLSVTTSGTALDTNATSIATFTVNNLSAVAAAGTRLMVNFPAGLVPVSADGMGCSVDAASVFSCPGVTLAANSSQSVALTVRASSAGTRRLATVVTSNLGDPDATNNSAAVTLTVTDVVVVMPPATGGGGSGGGALGGELLGLALALGLSRRRWWDRLAYH